METTALPTELYPYLFDLDSIPHKISLCKTFLKKVESFNLKPAQQTFLGESPAITKQEYLSPQTNITFLFLLTFSFLFVKITIDI